MLPVTDTIEEGRARLELPQISASTIYEVISDLKRFPLQSRAAELPRYSETPLAA
jgi:predicted DNA-binding transcriptional regulator AlpA